MAEYKVPQDVEADDKLLGPFTFRQFIYLMVSGGCIALAVALFNVFPLLIIIPAPVAIFFAILALPLKKDQPMETYLAAIISYHLKPKKRFWTPGQRESTIMITAPKIIENSRTRDITGEEANTRLSFLANVIDTEGYAIRDNSLNPALADSVNLPDMFDRSATTNNIDNIIDRNQNTRRANLVSQMRTAIENANSVLPAPTTTQQPTSEPIYNPLRSPTVIRPNGLPNQGQPSPEDKNTKAKLQSLASNDAFSIETIAKEANRIDKNKKKDKDEIYVSLH